MEEEDEGRRGRGRKKGGGRRDCQDSCFSRGRAGAQQGTVLAAQSIGVKLLTLQPGNCHLVFIYIQATEHDRYKHRERESSPLSVSTLCTGTHANEPTQS
eukprot:1844285-Rhodomonas_salina.4